jgi:hypothetical protein
MDTSCFCQCVSQAGVHSSHEPCTWSSWLNQNLRTARRYDPMRRLLPSMPYQQSHTLSRTNVKKGLSSSWTELLLLTPLQGLLAHALSRMLQRFLVCLLCKRGHWNPSELEACNIQYTWIHRKTRPDKRKWFLSHKTRRLMTLVWDKTVWFHQL